MSKQIQLLFIDDDLINHRLVQKAVEHSPIAYTGCASSEEAKGLLQTRFFDVIAQDVIRPGDQMDGLSFTLWLRRCCPDQAQRSVPVIIVSACDTNMLAEEQQRCGFDAYFDPSAIKEKLVTTITGLFPQ